MENTIANKEKFFAQYYTQRVLIRNPKDIQYDDVIENTHFNWDGWMNTAVLELKPLSSISDDQLKRLCIMAHNLSEVKSFEITRNNDDSAHCSFVQENIKAKYHICLNYKYATINANLHFDKKGDDEAVSYKVNIAEIHFSATRVAGHIQCIDYFRKEGFAIPFEDLSVEDQIKYNWIKPKP